jgi:hypothetical protein
MQKDWHSFTPDGPKTTMSVDVHKAIQLLRVQLGKVDQANYGPKDHKKYKDPITASITNLEKQPNANADQVIKMLQSSKEKKYIEPVITVIRNAAIKRVASIKERTPPSEVVMLSPVSNTQNINRVLPNDRVNSHQEIDKILKDFDDQLKIIKEHAARYIGEEKPENKIIVDGLNNLHGKLEVCATNLRRNCSPQGLGEFKKNCHQAINDNKVAVEQASEGPGWLMRMLESINKCIEKIYCYFRDVKPQEKPSTSEQFDSFKNAVKAMKENVSPPEPTQEEVAGQKIEILNNHF